MTESAPTKQVPQQNYFFSEEETAAVVKKPVDKASDLVGDVLAAGIEHKVRNDEGTKEKILEAADAMIDTHINVAKSQADKADKEAYFEANEAACRYFGYDEKTTSKSHVKIMSAWAWFFNTLYIFTIGFFVVAPISFFFHKIRVVIKHTWLVLILAVLIYALIVLTPFFIVWLGRV